MRRLPNSETPKQNNALKNSNYQRIEKDGNGSKGRPTLECDPVLFIKRREGPRWAEAAQKSWIDRACSKPGNGPWEEFLPFETPERFGRLCSIRERRVANRILVFSKASLFAVFVLSRHASNTGATQGTRSRKAFKYGPILLFENSKGRQ